MTVHDPAPDTHPQTIVRRNEHGKHAELRLIAPRDIPAGAEVHINMVTGVITVKDPR